MTREEARFLAWLLSEEAPCHFDVASYAECYHLAQEVAKKHAKLARGESVSPSAFLSLWDAAGDAWFKIAQTSPYTAGYVLRAALHAARAATQADPAWKRFDIEYSALYIAYASGGEARNRLAERLEALGLALDDYAITGPDTAA